MSIVCSCIFSILWLVWATSKHAAKILLKIPQVFSCVRTKLGGENIKFQNFIFKDHPNVWWLWLTSKHVTQFVSDSWVSCISLFGVKTGMPHWPCILQNWSLSLSPLSLSLRFNGWSCFNNTQLDSQQWIQSFAELSRNTVTCRLSNQLLQRGRPRWVCNTQQLGPSGGAV